MPDASRRDFLSTLAAVALGAPRARIAMAATPAPSSAARAITVRTITAGVALDRLGDRAAVDRALGVLDHARRRFEAEGYVVQTTRVTLPPRVAALDGAARSRALDAIRGLDARVAAAGARLGLGPVLVDDRRDDTLAEWAAELVRATKMTQLQRRHRLAHRVVYASTAPASPPRSPARWRRRRGRRRELPLRRRGERARGRAVLPRRAGTTARARSPWALQSANLVKAAFDGANGHADARRRLTVGSPPSCKEVERVASGRPRAERLAYAGIEHLPRADRRREHRRGDRGADRRAVRGRGRAQRLLRSSRRSSRASARPPLRVLGAHAARPRGCGARAAGGRGRFSVRELLLFSSVCGTGLDVVPIPGDTPLATLTNIMRDVATEAVRLSEGAVGAAVPDRREGAGRPGALRRSDADGQRRDAGDVVPRPSL